MEQELNQPSAESAEEPRLDEGKLRQFMLELESQQNLAFGIFGGLAAALAGAAVWAIVTVGTGYQIGWMAIGVGFLVGYAVRIFGKGISQLYGYIGAALALLGCLAGNLLAVCGMIAQEQGMAFFAVLAQVDIEVGIELMKATFSLMDLLFYGIAVYEGYRFSFRQISQEELAGLAQAGHAV